RGVGLASAGKVAFWTFAAMLIGQLGFLVISRVASGASVPGDGNASNAAYTNAYLVFMLPHSLIAVSLATALFTSLAKDAAEKDTAAVIGDFSMGVRMVGLINAFATAALIVLASPVAMVIAGTGREQAMAIGLVIITMAFVLVPFSPNHLDQRVLRLLGCEDPLLHPAAADHLPVTGRALGIDLPEIGDGGDHRPGDESGLPVRDDPVVLDPQEAP